MSDANDRPLTGLASVPGPDAFREEFDESLAEVLDMRSWRQGRDPADEYARIEREVKEAVAAETEFARATREELLPLLKLHELAEADLYEATAEEIVQAQRGALFNGLVQACDGTNDVHDTLAMTTYKLGVALVSYRGEESCWQTQLFRRDMRPVGRPRLEEAIDFLQRRVRRPGLHAAAAAADQLSELARRGVTSYMERRILLKEATAPWLMGHGSPAPLELVGTGFTDLVIRSIRLVRELVEHGRFIFVGSEQAHRGEMTLGLALRPCEFAIIGNLEMHLREALDDWKPRHDTTEDLVWAPGEQRISAKHWMARFREEICPQVVYGIYRATEIAMPQLFFAHRDHFRAAAIIAIADSRLNERRGFPMLIDLADRVCRSAYAGGSLRSMCETAYAHAGAPFMFQSERATRDH